MNTNPANLYTPEAIAIREQEGMVLCDDCLTEMYASDLDTHRNPANNWLRGGCPGVMEYAAQYAAAPELENWDEVDSETLDSVQRKIADSRHSASAAGGVYLTNWATDSNGVAWALEQAQQRQVMMAQDEDGYYFAVVTRP